MSRHSSRLSTRTGPNLSYNMAYHPIDNVLHPIRAQHALRKSNGSSSSATNKKTKSGVAMRRPQSNRARVELEASSNDDAAVDSNEDGDDIIVSKRRSSRSQAKKTVLYDSSIHPQDSWIPGPALKGKGQKRKRPQAQDIPSITFDDTTTGASEPSEFEVDDERSGVNSKGNKSSRRISGSKTSIKCNDSSSNKSSNTNSDQVNNTTSKTTNKKNSNKNSKIVDWSSDESDNDDSIHHISNPHLTHHSSSSDNKSDHGNSPIIDGEQSSAPSVPIHRAAAPLDFIEVDDEALFSSESEAAKRTTNQNDSEEKSTYEELIEELIPPLHSTAPRFTPINVLDETILNHLTLPTEAIPPRKSLRTSQRSSQRTSIPSNQQAALAAKAVQFRDFMPHENAENISPQSSNLLQAENMSEQN